MTGRAEAWAGRVAHLGRSRRLRVTTVIMIGALAIFTLTGFFGVPLLLDHVAQGTAAAILHRRVTVGPIRFNPYTLELCADTLRVREREGDEDFATVGRIRLKVSWSSLYRLAPIIQELTIEAPVVNLVRYHSYKFNFADLLKIRLPHFRFSVSNIRLNSGRVNFEDQPFNEHHTVDQIQIGVPFIGNLPAETAILVQPSLQMVIDGSPFRLVGEALPFKSTPESILNVNVSGLDLTRAAPYLEHIMPIKLQRGSLSTKLQLHFMRPASGPVLKIGGTINVEGVDVHDASNAPLVSFKTAKMALIDVDPVLQIAIVGDIGVDGLAAHFVRHPGGSTNFTPLITSPARKTAVSVKNAGSKNGEGTSFHAFVRSFEFANSELDLEDETTSTPISLALKGVHFGVRNFAYDEQAPAFPFQVQAHLGDGSLGLTGNVDLPHSHAAVEATLHKIDLRPLQGFAERFWAGTLTAGQLSAKAQIQTDFAPDKFNVVVQPADLFLETLELHAPGDTQKPVKLKTLDVALDRFDLKAHRAAVKEVHLDGLSLSVTRSRDGSISLDAFLRAGEPQFSAPAAAGAKFAGKPTKGLGGMIEAQNRPATITPAAPSKPAPAWQYQIASLALQNAETEVEDDSTGRPIILSAAPLNVNLKDVSGDLTKPIALKIDATLKPYGGIKVDGTVGIEPIAVKLHVVTTKVDLSPADAYLSSRLNVKISGAALTMDGNLEAARERDNFSLSYRGDAALGNLLLTDRLTNERLLRCSALRASRIDANIGEGARVGLGGVVLSDFHARVILNSNAKLNLGEVVAAPEVAPNSGAGAIPRSGYREASTAKRQPVVAAAPAKPPIDADIRVGGIKLEGGAIDYTDNFISPHYTVALTHLSGTIGDFGTRSTTPAEVEVHGLINSVSPIAITGSVNPLAFEAFVDIKAQSDGYQLINLTAYSAKYTGYPITMGTLKVDVHYLVQNRQLTATNHLFISRLSLGKKLQSPHATDLPIGLAVKLLKNPRGEIDITVPVSGSLDDPQFSVGGLLLQAVKDGILKIVESPFEALAAVAGVEGRSSQHLEHVPFPPGQATLTPAATSQLLTVAKAMQNRPELRLTLTPSVDPSTDRPALAALMVDRLVKMQKVEELRAQGDSAEVATVELTPDEYHKYLTVAYKQAKFDKRPNSLGSDKSPPPDEMKRILAENMKVTDDDLMKLAIARVVAVGDCLDQQVDPVRLAVVPPNIGASETNDSGLHAAGVDLSVD